MRVKGAVVAVAAATAVLAGCGGGGGTAAPGASGSAPAASAAAESGGVTAAAVQEDVRAAAAAGGFPEPAFADAGSPAMRARPCQVAAGSRTPAAPDRKAAARVVAELQKRGWRAESPDEDEDGVSWLVDKDGWHLQILAGATSKEAASGTRPIEEQILSGDFTGLMVIGGRMRCEETATPAP
ncbi:MULTISPECIES: hypothetical protein [unclassified Streptomyces]|uniref:hypothetical protein n=1 Tax=unclassified Streptomyces TaxID=2593676 RepID=UPI003D71DA68